MKGDRERVVSKIRGAVDQVARRIRNPIDRVICGMRVQLDLEHDDNNPFRFRSMSRRPQINQLRTPLAAQGTFFLTIGCLR